VPVVLALAAAAVYGAADFLGGLAGRRATTLSVVLWSQAAGLVLLVAVLPFFGGHAVAADIAWGALCGIAGGIAIESLYRGLATGTMGIVSPISAVLGASIPVVYGLVFRGEHPGAFALAGIVAALAAVVLVSYEPGGRRGVPEALVAGVGFGTYFIALAQTRAAAGMVPLFAARFTTVILLAAGGLAFGRVAQLRLARQAVPLVMLCGVFDVSANVLYVLAAHGGMLAIVAVLTSLYPAATVALAAGVLHERLNRVQWIGVALALAGAAAISSGS